MPHEVSNTSQGVNLKLIMRAKLKKIGEEHKEERKKEFVYRKIEKLHCYHSRLMECYLNTVKPYGLGYDMPDDVRQHATKIAEQAARVRKKMQKLEKEVGIIIPQSIPASNARPLSMDELKAFIKQIADERANSKG